MGVTQLVVFILSSVFVASEAYYVTPFSKCHSRDNECLRNYFQTVVSEMARNGLPQLGVPSVDPVVIKDFRAAVPGWLDLELLEGVGEGLRSCLVNKFWMSFEKRYASVELICDVAVEGHYRAYSNSSLIRNLLDGDVIYGDGLGKVKIEKLKMVYDFNFRVEKRGADSFINCDFLNSKFGIEILRGATFGASNLYLGQREASDTIVGIMNQYWKMILDATGLPVMDGICKFIFEFTQKYLNTVPMRTYLIDEVSTYDSRFPWRY